MATTARPTRAPRTRKAATPAPLTTTRTTARVLPETVAATDEQDGYSVPNPKDVKSLSEFLNSHHPEYLAGWRDWAAADRRAFGGSPAISELRPFLDESEDEYEQRKANASWVNFVEIFASSMTGHIIRQMGVPNMGTMGAVRERGERTGQPPTLGELTYDNFDGIGADGQSLPVWLEQQVKSVFAAPYRWLYAEMPRLADVRAAQGRPLVGQATAADVAVGLRSYAVSYAPQDVTNWHTADGRREWMVVRPHVRTPLLTSEGFQHDYQRSYLLLVRTGCTALGDAFAGGGWWSFAPDMEPIAYGDWSRTRGEIPMAVLLYEGTAGLRDAPPVPESVRAWDRAGGIPYGAAMAGGGPGTPNSPRAWRRHTVTHYPAMARSPGLELSNLSVALMNADSERKSNARASSRAYAAALGVSPITTDAEGRPVSNNFNDFTAQLANGAVVPALPYSLAEVSHTADGQITRQVVVPSIDPNTVSPVPSAIYEGIIESIYAQAKEIMARELIAAPHSSGASKQAGFIEGKSARLALLAANIESALNSLLYFMELRNGAVTPTAYVTLTRDYDLLPVADTIDRAMLRIKDSGLTSKTALVALVMQAMDEDSLFPDDRTRELVESELLASAELPSMDTAMIDRALGGVAAADSSPAEPGAADALAPTSNVARTDPLTADHASGALDAALRPGATRPPRVGVAPTPGSTPPVHPAAARPFPAHAAHAATPAQPADDGDAADDAADAQQIADATVAAILAALGPRLTALEQKVAALDVPPPVAPPSQIVAVESARPRTGAITFNRDAAGRLTGITLPPTSE